MSIEDGPNTEPVVDMTTYTPVDDPILGLPKLQQEPLLPTFGKTPLDDLIQMDEIGND
ncbi:MAG: hypothetical protein M3P98_02375 [bacterium]|nr:hypothetical protein [bacterium]